jgi:REP element-mobilizing transposase RayT
MPRSERYQEGGGIYHITARGVRRTRICRDHHDYESFERLFEWVCRDHGWKCLAYVLMPNHYHGLIELTEPNLSQGMHRLNFRHANRFNRRYDLTGHVFERRFYSDDIEDEAHLFEATRYIVLNPVRAKICPHPGLWRWSSYAPTLGRRRSKLVSVERFTSFFGTDPAVYAAYVAEAISA